MTNTTKMSDRDYEILTKNIYRSLLNAEDYDFPKIDFSYRSSNNKKP